MPTAGAALVRRDGHARQRRCGHGDAAAARPARRCRRGARARHAPAPAGAPEVFLAALPPDGDGPASGHYNGKLERPAIHRPAPSNATLAAWDFSIGMHTQSGHRYRAARGPRPPRQPADARDDGIELDRRGARLEDRPRPVRRHPFPRRRPGATRLERKRSPRHSDGLAQRLLRRAYQQRCRRGLHPLHRAAAPAAGGRGAAGADVQLSGLWLLRPPGPRRGDRRTRRRMARAARDARHEPAIRAVLLQPTQRRLRRVAGHAIAPDAGHEAAAIRADGSGGGRIGHGALGCRQLHRPVPVHHRCAARRHHRS